MFATFLSSPEDDLSWCTFHTWTSSIPAPWLHVFYSVTYTCKHTPTHTHTHTHALIKQPWKLVILQTLLRIKFPAVLPWWLLILPEKGWAIYSVRLRVKQRGRGINEWLGSLAEKSMTPTDTDRKPCCSKANNTSTRLGIFVFPIIHS